MKEFTNPLYEGKFSNLVTNSTYKFLPRSIRYDPYLNFQPLFLNQPGHLDHVIYGVIIGAVIKIIKIQNQPVNSKFKQFRIVFRSQQFHIAGLAPLLVRAAIEKTLLSNLSPAIKNFAKKCNNWQIRGVENFEFLEKISSTKIFLHLSIFKFNKLIMIKYYS